jgi:hypothetical protein
MRTGADDVAVGQEAPVDRRPHLTHGALLDQAGGVEPCVEVLGQGVVLPAGRAAEMVERQAEAPIDVGLDGMLRIAVVLHVRAGLDRTELGRRAVLVGAADEQHLVSDLAAETRMHVGGQERADEIAEVLDPVDVGQRAGDQNFAHDTSVCVRDAEPEIGIGVGLTASPSHTTVHTGPYTAVRWVKRPCSPRGKLGRARRGRRSGER